MAIGSISSERGTIHPTWMQWIIPSIADLIFVVLLGLLVYSTLSVRLLGDAGIGWHIRTGQLILSTHAIPRVDPFSSSMAGHPWFAWEWLYDVLVGWLESAAGLNAIVCFTALIIALTFSWTFRLLLRRDTNFLLALVLVLLAASAGMIHFFARPHVVSWLLTVLWFWILESSEKADQASPTNTRHRWPLWSLLFLTILWVNVHGGFLVGFALMGIYCLSAAWEYFRLSEARIDDALQKIKAGKRARDLAFIGVLSALATFANPYGWGLHVHIYRYLSNRFLMDHIDEFQSPNFHGVAQKCFAVLLMLALVALAVPKRRMDTLRLSEVLLVLFAVYSGLYASRNIPVSALLLILVIGPRLSQAQEAFAEMLAKRRIVAGSRNPASLRFLERMQAIESSLQGHLWPVAAVLLTWWIVFHGGKLGPRPLIDAHFDAKRFPVAAVSYLERHSLRGQVFAPDSWGGYIVYRLYPQSRVVVDDRHDFYGEAFLKSYLKTMHVEPGWKDFLRQHPAQWIVVPKDSGLANLLAEADAWKVIYSDDGAVVFTAAAAPIDQNPSTTNP